MYPSFRILGCWMLYLLWTGQCLAQDCGNIPAILSISSKLSTQEKVDSLNECAYIYTYDNRNWERVEQYAKTAIEFAQKNNYPKGTGVAYYRLGNMEMERAFFDKARENFLQSISWHQKAEEWLEVAKVYNSIGLTYQRQGRLEVATTAFQNGLESLKKVRQVEKLLIKKYIRANILLNLGDVLGKQGLYQNAVTHLSSGLALADSLGDNNQKAWFLLNLGALYYEDSFNDTSLARKYLMECLKIFETQKDKRGIAKAHINLGNLFFYENKNNEALVHYQKAEEVGLAPEDVVKVYANRGSIYHQQKAYSKARDLYLTCLPICKDTFELARIYTNLGINYFHSEDYERAVSYLRKSLQFQDSLALQKLDIYSNLSETYHKLKQHDSTHYFSSQYRMFNDKLNTVIKEANNARIALANEREGKAVLEKEKVQLAKQNLEKRMLNWGLGFLLLLVIVTFLAWNNHKQRQLAEKTAQIAYKNEQIARQEVDELLREQEVKTTYARLEGQEKERKRIAQDLHDKIGNMLSTIKLYFSGIDARVLQLQEENQKQYKKVTDLLDKTSNEVRRISHNMLSPVLAERGLAAELEVLVDRIRGAQQLDIQLDTHGLNKRLETLTAVNIYRIIQELVGNALKYAAASRIDIQVSRFDDLVNVMVADNGKGFNVEQLQQQKKRGRFIQYQ